MIFRLENHRHVSLELGCAQNHDPSQKKGRDGTQEARVLYIQISLTKADSWPIRFPRPLTCYVP